jgi:hypothetical protein
MQCIRYGEFPDEKVSHSKAVMPDLKIWKQTSLLTIKMLHNRCMGIYKFGNKYLPSTYKTRFEIRSPFFGGKKCVLQARKYSISKLQISKLDSIAMPRLKLLYLATYSRVWHY